MKKRRFPKGWDEARVKRALAHHESQSEDEAMEKDEAAWEDSSQTLIEIPNDLVSTLRELLAERSEKVASKTNQKSSRGITSQTS